MFMKKLAVFIGLVCLCVTGIYAKGWKAEHVVMIAFDGWGAYSVPKADIPNIRRMMDEGCAIR